MRKKPLTGNGALPPLPLQSAVGSQYLINWTRLYLEQSKRFSCSYSVLEFTCTFRPIFSLVSADWHLDCARICEETRTKLKIDWNVQILQHSLICTIIKFNISILLRTSLNDMELLCPSRSHPFLWVMASLYTGCPIIHDRNCNNIFLT